MGAFRRGRLGEGKSSKNEFKISIADGATVTFRDVTVNGVDNDSCKWAGVTCLGNALFLPALGSWSTSGVGTAVLSLSCYGQEGAREGCRGHAVK